MKKKRLYEVDFIASYDFASLYPTTMSRPKIHKKLLRTSKINKIWKKIKE
jgi:DNA polymerase elongation subunit (family B)